MLVLADRLAATLVPDPASRTLAYALLSGEPVPLLELCRSRMLPPESLGPYIRCTAWEPYLRRRTSRHWRGPAASRVVPRACLSTYSFFVLFLPNKRSGFCVALQPILVLCLLSLSSYGIIDMCLAEHSAVWPCVQAYLMR